MAPGATIHYYVGNDLNTPIEQALTDNTVDILSYSYYVCEKLITTADNVAINKMWEQAAAQGIAVTVATGDGGSANCDDPNSNGQDVATAINGLAVNAYASTPYDVAVGGTDFVALDQNFAGYSNSGGSAKTYYRTALKYIPEAVWNNSTQSDNALTNNQPWGIGLSVYPANIIAGGGGASNCSTNNTALNTGGCISGYSKPSWQRGAGVPGDGVRDLPDTSLMAGNNFYNASWLVCDDTTNLSSGLANNCAVQPDGSYNYAAFGGTSTSAPAFATAGRSAQTRIRSGNRRIGRGASTHACRRLSVTTANGAFQNTRARHLYERPHGTRSRRQHRSGDWTRGGNSPGDRYPDAPAPEQSHHDG